MADETEKPNNQLPDGWWRRNRESEEAFRENPFALPPAAAKPPHAELRAPAPRPADAMAPVSEMLSPTMGAYGTASLLTDSALRAKDRDWSGIDYPSLLGMFIGPMGAKNLAAARIRHADDWGGINRLKAAQEQWKRGEFANMTSGDVWREHGWTPAHTWGITAHYGEPATSIATPYFRINEDMLRSMPINGKNVFVNELPFKDFVRGADDIMVAEPLISNMRTRVLVDPNTSAPGGVQKTNIEMPNEPSKSQRRQAGMRSSLPPTLIPEEMRIVARTASDANDLLLHEAQHGVAMPQKVAIPRDLTRHEMMMPLHGTYAEIFLRQEIEKYRNQLARAQTPKEVAMLKEAIKGLGEYLERVPGYAGYLNSSRERIARENFLRGWSPEERHRQEVPGSLDTYQRGALGAGLENREVIPLPFFDPKFERAHGGRVEESSMPKCKGSRSRDQAIELALSIARHRTRKADGGEVSGEPVRSPVPDWLLEQQHRYQSPDYEPPQKATDLPGPLAFMRDTGSFAAEMSGIPSIVRGYSAATSPNATLLNRARGAAELASGAIPAAGAVRQTAPIVSAAFKTIPRTMATMGILGAPDMISSATAQGAPSEAVKELQRKMRDAGFYFKEIDGVMGPATRDAKAAYDKAMADAEMREIERKKADAALKGATNKENEEKEAKEDKERARLKREQDLKKLEKVEEETPFWRTALRNVAPWAGYGLGLYAGSKAAKFLPARFGAAEERAVARANELMRGNLTSKTLHERIGRANQFATEGGAKAPPFTQMSTAPYWKINNSAPPSSQLYRNQSRAAEYVLNPLAATGVFGGEAAVTTWLAHEAHKELDAAREEMNKDPTDTNIARYQAAQDKVAGWEAASNVGRIAAPIQMVKGIQMTYTRPHPRPDIGKADAERGAIAEKLAEKRAEVSKERAKRKQETEKTRSQKPKEPKSPSDAAASIPPAAIAPALLSGAHRTEPNVTPALDEAPPNDATAFKNGGAATQHHSHYQPRDRVGRYAGGPVYAKAKKSEPVSQVPREEMPWTAVARKYAQGGLVPSGPIFGPTGGRADAKPISVRSGSYVIPADVVSAAGGGNTIAGAKVFENMFKTGPYGIQIPKASKTATRNASFSSVTKGAKSKFADGGAMQSDVPILISDGEYVVSPEAVAHVGNGDMDSGHQVLDAMVKRMRADHIKTLKSLPPPVKD